MNKKVLPICSAIAFLSGCAAPPQPLPPPQLSIPSADVQAELIQAILPSLKDPDSAKFNEKMVLVNGRGACVEVNAKNSFGGYTGFQQAVLQHYGPAGWQVVTMVPSRDVCIKALR